MKTCTKCKREKEEKTFFSNGEILKTCESCRKPGNVECEKCHMEMSKTSLTRHMKIKHSSDEELKQQTIMTEEQEEVISSCLQGKNIRVIAKAGTGKTSMALELAKRAFIQHKKTTLILTYNAALKKEVSDKVSEMGRSNYIDVHNYHTLCNKLYNSRTCRSDQFIEILLNTEIKNLPNYDIIIIDEAQDMKDLFFHIIEKMLLLIKPVILLMGDPFQRLYENAGKPYLNYEKYFSVPFFTLHLSISFRITHEMAEYVNLNCNPNTLVRVYPEAFSPQEKENINLWWGSGIHASPKRKTEPNSVEIVDESDLDDVVCKIYEIFDCSQTVGLDYSVKNVGCPVGALANRIPKKYGEPKIVSRESTLKYVNNMRNYSTICQSKGKEFDVVIFPNFVNFWNDSMNNFRNDRMRLFNHYYVALTRAKKKILICEKMFRSSFYCTHMKYSHKEQEIKKNYISVCNLLEFVPVMNKNIYRVIDKEEIGNDTKVSTVHIGSTETYKVDLTHYVAKAIEFKTCIIKEKEGLNKLKSFLEYWKELVKKKFKNLTVKDEIRLWNVNMTDSWKDLIKLAVVKDIVSSGYEFLWKQITDQVILSAVNEKFLKKCLDNVLKCIEDEKKLEFEKRAAFITGCDFLTEDYHDTIHGFCDIKTKDSLIEVKVSSNVCAEEHILQALTYASIFRLTKDPKKEGKNIKIENVYLFYANKGLRVKIQSLLPPEEFLYWILARKCNHSPNSADELFTDLHNIIKATF